MTNLEKYKNAFVESFDLDVKEVENASQETVEIWDSIGMMSLIAVIEDSFDLELQPDDIVEFTSYQKGIELLKKYNVILLLYFLVGLCIFLLLYQENLRLISIREKLFVGYIEIFVCCTCCFASHKNSLD